MENLVTCSKILYDKDICDKMDEITSLKNQLRKYQISNIKYSSWKEWQSIKIEAFLIIRKGIDEWCLSSNSHFDYHMMQGLEMWQSWRDIKYVIEEALNLITKDKEKEWSNYMADKIIYGILGFFNGLYKSLLWEPISNYDIDYERHKKRIADLVYNNIIWQLNHNNDDYDSYSYLDELAVFICSKCKKETNSVSELDICSDCEEGYL